MCKVSYENISVKTERDGKKIIVGEEGSKVFEVEFRKELSSVEFLAFKEIVFNYDKDNSSVDLNFDFLSMSMNGVKEFKVNGSVMLNVIDTYFFTVCLYQREKLKFSTNV